MTREHSLLRTKQVLTAAAAALVATSLMAVAPATAQQPDQVAVPMPEVMLHEVGRTESGIPIDEISLTRAVGYGDLDLTAPSGVATLKVRITDTAKQACSQLDTLYPPAVYPSDTPDQDCVKSAVDDGMAQVKAVIAAAGVKSALNDGMAQAKVVIAAAGK